MSEENKNIEVKSYTEAEVAELVKKAVKEAAKETKTNKSVKSIKVSRWGSHLAERGIK